MYPGTAQWLSCHSGRNPRWQSIFQNGRNAGKGKNRTLDICTLQDASAFFQYIPHMLHVFRIQLKKHENL